MAKPIEATPALKGKDADRFFRNMAKKENSPLTETERDIMRSIMFMKDGKTPRCYYCGQAMKNYTPKTGRFKGKLDKHSWTCGCSDFSKIGIVLSVL